MPSDVIKSLIWQETNCLPFSVMMFANKPNLENRSLRKLITALEVTVSGTDFWLFKVNIVRNNEVVPA